MLDFIAPVSYHGLKWSLLQPKMISRTAAKQALPILCHSTLREKLEIKPWK